MRLLIAALTLASATAQAQQAPATQDTCVDVQVGNAQSYNCLNQQLQQALRNAPRFSSDTNAPYNANSPSNVTGQFNESATRNRLGSNFGKSVTPERPAQVFVAPK
jgi:hypothetical protein